MKPGHLDLPTIWRGCDYGPIILSWKDQDGAPFNLDGWLPRAQSLHIDLHPVITNPEQGETQIALSRTETASLKLGVETWDWIWDHQVNGGQRLGPFLSGTVTIKEPQTNFPPEL